MDAKIITKIYVQQNLECITEKIDECKNNPENSSATIRFSVSRIFSTTSTETKHDVYKGNDCMNKFCEFLREHVTKIINFKKKK